LISYYIRGDSKLKYSQLSNWTKKYSDTILFIIFIIGWSISTIKWISQDPLLGIYGIIFYYVGLLYPIIISFLVRFIIPYRIRDDKLKREQLHKPNKSLEARRLADSINFKILHTLLNLALSLIMAFINFSYNSYFLVLYVSLYFSILFVFLFVWISNKKKIIPLILYAVKLSIIGIVTVLFPNEQYYIVHPYMIIFEILIPIILYVVVNYFKRRNKK